MNTTICATVEPSTSLSRYAVTQLTNAAEAINANPFGLFDTLDKVEAFLKAGITNSENGLGDPSGWHVHRGGSHVALIRVTGPGPFGSPRVLLVTERRPEPEPLVMQWPDDVDYDGVAATEARAKATRKAVR